MSTGRFAGQHWVPVRCLILWVTMTAPVAGAQGLGRLARQSRTAWARSQYVIAETRMLAKVVAATEDQVAVTFARLAERRPDSAARQRSFGDSLGPPHG